MKVLRSLITGILASGIILSGVTMPVMADKDIHIVVNDKELKFDEGFPQIVADGVTMVPIRIIFEALGFAVSYNQGVDEQGSFFRIWAIKSDEDIRLDMYLGEHEMFKSINSEFEMSTARDKLADVSKSYYMPVVPFVDETDCTLVPARVIAESIGAVVNWDQATKTVIIDYHRCGDDVSYKLNKGVLTITGNGPMWDQTPSSLPAYVDESIDASGENVARVKKVIFDAGVTSIGNYALYGCNYLETIEIKGNISQIGEYAFANCTALKSIDVPENTKKLYAKAFSGCSSLQKVNLPATLNYLALSAFDNCASLTEINYASSRDEWNRIGFMPRPTSDFMKIVHFSK